MSEPLQHWIDGESVASVQFARACVGEYLETKTVVVSL